MYVELNVPAEVKELKPFINWLENLCVKINIADEKKSKLLISAEEIFVNIAYYAYPDQLKDQIQKTVIAFKYDEIKKQVALIFTDNGIPYNPLLAEEPDINTPLEERTPGGFGILMVKNMMDSVEYEYKDKCNILTLKLHV